MVLRIELKLQSGYYHSVRMEIDYVLRVYVALSVNPWKDDKLTSLMWHEFTICMVVKDSCILQIPGFTRWWFISNMNGLYNGKLPSKWNWQKVGLIMS